MSHSQPNRGRRSSILQQASYAIRAPRETDGPRVHSAGEKDVPELASLSKWLIFDKLHLEHLFQSYAISKALYRLVAISSALFLWMVLMGILEYTTLLQALPLLPAEWMHWAEQGGRCSDPHVLVIHRRTLLGFRVASLFALLAFLLWSTSFMRKQQSGKGKHAVNSITVQAATCALCISLAAFQAGGSAFSRFHCLATAQAPLGWLSVLYDFGIILAILSSGLRWTVASVLAALHTIVCIATFLLVGRDRSRVEAGALLVFSTGAGMLTAYRRERIARIAFLALVQVVRDTSLRQELLEKMLPERIRRALQYGPHASQSSLKPSTGSPTMLGSRQSGSTGSVPGPVGDEGKKQDTSSSFQTITRTNTVVPAVLDGPDQLSPVSASSALPLPQAAHSGDGGRSASFAGMLRRLSRAEPEHGNSASPQGPVINEIDISSTDRKQTLARPRTIYLSPRGRRLSGQQPTSSEAQGSGESGYEAPNLRSTATRGLSVSRISDGTEATLSRESVASSDPCPCPLSRTAVGEPTQLGGNSIEPSLTSVKRHALARTRGRWATMANMENGGSSVGSSANKPLHGKWYSSAPARVSSSNTIGVVRQSSTYWLYGDRSSRASMSLHDREEEDAEAEGYTPPAHYYPSVAVLFVYVDRFNEVSGAADPLTLVSFLNKLYKSMDRIVEKAGCYKVMAIANMYLIVAGAPEPVDDPTARLAACAISIMKYSSTSLLEVHGIRMNLQAGLHTGELAAGVIGTRTLNWHVYGDTVNLASRMCSTGAAGKIQVSFTSAALLQGSQLGLSGSFYTSPRGRVYCKGKGMVDTAWLSDIELDSLEESADRRLLARTDNLRRILAGRSENVLDLSRPIQTKKSFSLSANSRIDKSAIFVDDRSPSQWKSAPFPTLSGDANSKGLEEGSRAQDGSVLSALAVGGSVRDSCTSLRGSPTVLSETVVTETDGDVFAAGQVAHFTSDLAIDGKLDSISFSRRTLARVPTFVRKSRSAGEDESAATDVTMDDSAPATLHNVLNHSGVLADVHLPKRRGAEGAGALATARDVPPSLLSTTATWFRLSDSSKTLWSGARVAPTPEGSALTPSQKNTFATTSRSTLPGSEANTPAHTDLGNEIVQSVTNTAVTTAVSSISSGKVEQQMQDEESMMVINDAAMGSFTLEFRDQGLEIRFMRRTAAQVGSVTMPTAAAAGVSALAATLLWMQYRAYSVGLDDPIFNIRLGLLLLSVIILALLTGINWCIWPYVNDGEMKQHAEALVSARFSLAMRSSARLSPVFHAMYIAWLYVWRSCAFLCLNPMAQQRLIMPLYIGFVLGVNASDALDCSPLERRIFLGGSIEYNVTLATMLPLFDLPLSYSLVLLCVVLIVFPITALSGCVPQSTSVFALRIVALVFSTVASAVLCRAREEAARYSFTVSDHAHSQQKRCAALLSNMLPSPRHVARLLQGEHVVESLPRVAMLYSDIVGFTDLCGRLTPSQLILLLDELYSEFDKAVAELGLYKVETIGDAFIAVGGLSSGSNGEEHAPEMVGRRGSVSNLRGHVSSAGPIDHEAQLAKSVRACAFLSQRMLHQVAALAERTGLPLAIRVGLHLDSAVGGVIGSSRPRYFIWGAGTVLANAMESTGVAGKCQVSREAAVYLKDAGGNMALAGPPMRLVPHQIVSLIDGKPIPRPLDGKEREAAVTALEMYGEAQPTFIMMLAGNSMSSEAGLTTYLLEPDADVESAIDVVGLTPIVEANKEKGKAVTAPQMTSALSAASAEDSSIRPRLVDA